MKSITFINRYFHPDHSATSQLLSDLAFELAQAGHDVQVITSRQRYDDSNAQLPAQEVTQGVRVYRVWTSRFGRQHLPGRALDYLTFYISASACLLRRARRHDNVVAMTDPPLMSVPVALICKLRRIRLVNWLQDLFPEVACALGLGMIQKLSLPLRWLRNRSLRAAQVNVVLGERMARHVSARGIQADRISIIHNWSDGAQIMPVIPADNPLRAAWGLGDRFVVGYSGNMGRAHEFDTILATAERLVSDSRIAFLFIGAGARRQWLEQNCRERGLTNVMFQPYQPRESLGWSLGVPDVHLVSLYPGLEGLIVPSKFYGIAAAGRAVIYVGDIDGEIPRQLRDGECGYTVVPGDIDTLASHLQRLSNDSALVTHLGSRARKLFDTRFDRSLAMRAWEDVLLASVTADVSTTRERAQPVWEIK